MKQTNMKRTQIRVIIADLIDQGIIKEVKEYRYKKYEYQFDAPALDMIKFDELREAKLKDLDSMIDYVFTKDARMKFLCEYLGDKIPDKFENCDNSKYKKRTVNADRSTRKKLKEFRDTYFPILDNVKSRGSNIAYGVASSYYGVSNVGAALHRSKYENGGDFPDFLLEQILKAYRKIFRNQHFDLIVYVPPTESGNLVKNFAIRVSSALEIPISHKLVKLSKTRPQKIFKNGYLKKSNVKDVFDYTNPKDIKDMSILLIDDIYDSGATVKEIGKLLTKLGATIITPLVIARTVGGDI